MGIFHNLEWDASKNVKKTVNCKIVPNCEKCVLETKRKLS